MRKLHLVSRVSRVVVAIVVLLVVRTVVADTTEQVQQQSMQRFDIEVKPLLQKFCVQCHGAEKQQADVRLDSLAPDMASGSDAEAWHDALNKLNLGEMPPAKSPQPSQVERAKLINWITDELKRATEQRRSTGGRVVMRRLTRYEYANTLRDLLRLDIDFAADLPAEPNSPDGLQNNGSSLHMSPQQLEQYLDIAREAVSKAIVTGDQPEVLKFDLSSSQLSNGKGPLHPPNVGMAVFPEYPMAGDFRIRVQASVSDNERNLPAIMRITMGIRASPKNLKMNPVGEVRVSGTAEAPQEFVFEGRMENVPLHDPVTAYGERRYPGLHVGIWNLSFDQQPPQQQKRNGKNKSDPVTASDESQGGRTSDPALRLHSVSFEGPVNASWPPNHHRQILFSSPLAETDEREYARQVLKRFTTRAFRRPATIEEVDRKLAVYDAHRPELDSLAATMREVLPEILVAHDFLYLAEPTDGRATKQSLTEFELAARLSYFLWSTMPDDGLSDLATSGQLHVSAEFEQHVRGMLKDVRSRRFANGFTDQWLKLSGLNRVAVNPDYYPDFNNDLKQYMRDETRHFFMEILNNDLSALNLLDSDFTMLNLPLAEHYGIAGPVDNEFIRVALKPSDHRGGLLGHGSVLLSNSSGDDSHPVYRGVWIRDRLLGDTPASPPPDVPDLDQENPDFASMSLKQKLEVHREKESCASCHRNIDPWGVPLENFDAVGRWRTSVERIVEPVELPKFNNGVRANRKKQPEKQQVPVESVSVLPGGYELNGFEDLKQHLLKNERDRFARALVRRMFSYALGRSLELVDGETVDSLVTTFEQSGYQLDELIVAITQSEQFQTK
ncbi:MAG: DUF1592 domain-containing protein [Planctomycetota bacterium]|nr:DUF1592 domain-containing protein [Planctomycetota bacterium]MDA1164058.1 DUF1592 domain-containing protein [Planctomycetota bacterium]